MKETRLYILPFRRFSGQIKTNRNAFTLTELLVTVAAILILAGIILTSLNRSRMRGHSLVSQNNLRQIVTGYINYEMEFGRFMPHSKAAHGGWVEELGNREKYNESVFFSQICVKKNRMGPGDVDTAWNNANPESDYEYVHHY